ncbi:MULTISPECIES: FkbM family methyltransferase [Bradyrhizobium]|uniref:FkbM family methyltransferase n=1 Tax=Bradyrhizobium elkanii TaxID=29448 RepID=UPI0009B743E0|nr:FkbM family methyltransferase [Bradyrhizobium elkanii]
MAAFWRVDFSSINSALYTPSLSKAHVLAQRAYLRSVRALKEHRKFETYFGARLSGNLSDYIPARIFSFGVWEPNLSRFMERKIGPETCAVDVGAHIGYFTLLMSKLAREVVAIEASPHNYQELSRHVAENGRRNITVVNKAVAASRGQMKLFESKFGGSNTGNCSLIAPRDGSNYSMIQTDTLIGILGDRAKRVSFIKIDIEGAERPVLEEIIRNADAFDRSLTVVAEVSDQNLDLIESFSAAGFKCSVLDNFYEFDAYLSGRIDEPRPWNGSKRASADLIFERTA